MSRCRIASARCSSAILRWATASPRCTTATTASTAVTSTAASATPSSVRRRARSAFLLAVTNCVCNGVGAGLAPGWPSQSSADRSSCPRTSSERSWPRRSQRSASASQCVCSRTRSWSTSIAAKTDARISAVSRSRAWTHCSTASGAGTAPVSRSPTTTGTSRLPRSTAWSYSFLHSVEASQWSLRQARKESAASMPLPSSSRHGVPAGMSSASSQSERPRRSASSISGSTELASWRE